MLSRTPKAVSVRTGLARKPVFLAAGVALVAIAGVGAWWFSNRPQPESGVRYATTDLRLGDKTYVLDIADTPAKQTLGLGKRVDLRPDQGMVFTYEEPGRRCFWMKDMGFPIDIIWLDSDQRVVSIRSEVRPETYPETFCPANAAQYVVELYPGVAVTAGLKAGDKLDFDL